MIRGTSVLALAAAAAVPFVQARVDRARGGFRAQHDVLYAWKGEQVARLVPGFEQLAADVYWLRTVQYFGAERNLAVDKRYELLYPLIEITTTLDPRMEIAYRYGSVFLAEPRPHGAGRPDLGVAVLERGARENPLSWRLRQELGFFHFVYLRDPTRAAAILTEASEIPGAAFWLKSLAAQVLAQGGERDIARRIWQEMYDRSEPGAIKDNARVHLRVIDAAAAADRLTAGVQAFSRRFGRSPHELRELAAAGLAGAPLVDSSGVPFHYDSQKGTVSVSRASALYREDLMGEKR